MATIRDLANDPVVSLALRLGYKPDKHNATARRHFYFYGPVQMCVSMFAGCDSWHYSIGHISTSSVDAAINYLGDVA